MLGGSWNAGWFLLPAIELAVGEVDDGQRWRREDDESGRPRNVPLSVQSLTLLGKANGKHSFDHPTFSRSAIACGAIANREAETDNQATASLKCQTPAI